MFAVAALLVFLICAENKFQVGETSTSGCAWEVAITTTMRPCTNTSLKLTDYHNPEAIKAILPADTLIALQWRLSFLVSTKYICNLVLPALLMHIFLLGNIYIQFIYIYIYIYIYTCICKYNIYIQY